MSASPSPRSFYGKLFLLAVAIAGFTVGMAFLLITFKVENTQRDLRHGRFDLIARDVDRVVEQNLLLGMTIDEMTTLPAVLARRQLADAGIISIDVADDTGRIVYSSNSAAGNGAGREMPPSWRAAIRQQQILQSNKSSCRAWRIKDDAENVAGTTVDNSFGVTKGYIAVRYTGAEGVSARDALREAMLPIVGAVFVVSTLILFGILWLLARRFERNAAIAVARVQGAGTDTASPMEWRAYLDPLSHRFDRAEAALAHWANAPAAQKTSPDTRP